MFLTNQKDYTAAHVHGNIPCYMFDCWADSVAHLLLLKSSTARPFNCFYVLTLTNNVDKTDFKNYYCIALAEEMLEKLNICKVFDPILK